MVDYTMLYQGVGNVLTVKQCFLDPLVALLPSIDFSLSTEQFYNEVVKYLCNYMDVPTD